MVKHMTNHPPYLTRGSLIGITCPSGYVPVERVRFAAEVLKLWGFDVVIGKTVGNEHHYFSGTDEQRATDLQQMLDNPDIKAILMGRGGYGLSRIIDRLDWTKFRMNPKWICGFSDITVLHSHIHSTLDIATLHSPMGGAFTPDTANAGHIKRIFACLIGESQHYHTAEHPLNIPGNGEGVLVGGNLAILAHLVGSVSDIDTTGKILFIEDIGEHLYKIDRMMLTLKRAGKLDNLKGLIVGGLTEMEDTERPFGKTAEEIIYENVAEYNYPVCFNFPAGHIEDNHTLALGMMYKLTVTDKGAHLDLEKDIMLS